MFEALGEEMEAFGFDLLELLTAFSGSSSAGIKCCGGDRRQS